MNIIGDFHFIYPLWLLSIPVAIWLLRTKQSESNTMERWRKHIEPEFLAYQQSLQQPKVDNAPANFGRFKQIQRRLLSAASVIASILIAIALAGPSWEKMPEPVAKSSDKLLVIADLSLSMHAKDVKPSRLIRMRYKLLELMKLRKQGETALIAYSGDAHVVSPFTEDSKNIAALIPTLAPEIMPAFGSDIVSAIALAAELINETTANTKNKTTVAIFSDEIFPSQVTEIRKLLSSQTTDVVIIGIGTENGGPIQLPSGQFIKNTDGSIVTAKLNRGNLQFIANELSGRYIDASNDNADVAYINNLASANANIEQSEIIGDANKWKNQGAWFALAALPFLALSYRRGALLCTFFVISCIDGSSSLLYPTAYANTVDVTNQQDTGNNLANYKWWQTPWKTRQQAAEALAKQGDFTSAEKVSAIPEFKAQSAFKAGDYPSANRYYQQVIEDKQSNQTKTSNTENVSDIAKLLYNQGHSHAHAGELNKSLEKYQEALNESPNYEEAKQAKALIEQLLNQQQNQQEQQKQDGQNSQNQSEQNQQGQQSEQNPQQSQQQQNQQGDQNQQQNSNDSDNNNNQSEDQQGADQSGSQGQSEANDQSQQNDESMLDSADKHAQHQQALQEQNEQQQANEEQVGVADQRKDQQEADNQTKPQTVSELQAQNDVPPISAETEKWLRQVPDNPSALLERKFRYERAKRERDGKVLNKLENDQIW